MKHAASSVNDLGRSFAEHQDLHPTDFDALMAVYEADRAERPLSSKELAQTLAVTPSAATYVVDRLVESGHVSREPSTQDRRRVDLHYSEHGFTVAESFFTALGQAYTKALASFSDAELKTAVVVMSTLIDATRAHRAGLVESEPKDA